MMTFRLKGVVALGLAVFIIARIPLLGAPTWYDEAGLLANSFASGLTINRPLDWLQSAPPGYLLLVDLTARAIPNWQLAVLRGLSLLAGCITLVLVAWLAARDQTPKMCKAGVVVGCCLWLALNPLLVQYQTLSKPYAIELCLAIALLASMLRGQRRTGLALCAIGPQFGFAFFLYIAAGVIFLHRYLPPRWRAGSIALGAFSSVVAFLSTSRTNLEAIQQANSAGPRSVLSQLLVGWPVVDSGLFPSLRLDGTSPWYVAVLLGLGILCWAIAFRGLLSRSVSRLTLTVLVVVTGATLLTGSALSTRAWLPAFVLLCIAIMVGLLRAVTRPAPASMMLLGLCTLLVTSLMTSGTYENRPNYESVSAIIAYRDSLFVDVWAGAPLDYHLKRADSPQRPNPNLLYLNGHRLTVCRPPVVLPKGAFIVSSQNLSGVFLDATMIQRDPYVSRLQKSVRISAPAPIAICEHPYRNPGLAW